MLARILPSKHQVARTLVRPMVTSTVRDHMPEEAADTVELSPVQEMVAEGAGIVAGLTVGAATTAVCALNYPISAAIVGTTTTAVMWNSTSENPDLKSRPLARAAVALGAGAVAAAYAPVVAGAVTAVAAEEVATESVKRYLGRPA